MTPTILFDIDGTLVRMGGVGRRAMNRAMEEEWGLADPLRDVSFVGGTDGDIARRVAPDKDPRPMWSRYVAHLAASVAPHDPLPGVVAVLDVLARAGARTALLTGNIEAGARIKLDAARLTGHFDFALSGFAEHGVQREEIAASVRARADGPLVVVGDTPADIRCARHIEARVLAVGTGYAPPADLTGADRYVDDLGDTASIADWLIG